MSAESAFIDGVRDAAGQPFTASGFKARVQSLLADYDRGALAQQSYARGAGDTAQAVTRVIETEGTPALGSFLASVNREAASQAGYSTRSTRPGAQRPGRAPLAIER